MIIQRFMIKSQALQYAGHDHGTSAGVSVTDLDRDAATIRKPGRVDRLSAGLCHQTGDCAVQFQLVAPSARNMFRMVPDRRRDLKLRAIECAGDVPESSSQGVERDRV